jgi:alkanesulfonate monooxygenase SsuD/methylene tetrahydromethanopterin reductase-like flavin-dependent oxidoreductase (luciferase family)
MARSILRLDMRAPGFSRATPGELYAAALDMAAWADERGFEAVALAEHHGVEDGYLPSPLCLAGAIAGRTRRIRVAVIALLLPLYDPVRLAEDLAVLDLASGGRVGVTAGLGYRKVEYDMLGIDWPGRGRVMDEKLAVLLAALRGEACEWRGRRIEVHPRPGSRPHPFLSVGGTGRNAARRAVRFDLPFQPSVQSEEVFDFYRRECAAHGRNAALIPPGSGESIWVSEDPERSWHEIGHHLLHHAASYAGWQDSGAGSVANTDASSIAALRAGGKYLVLTPEECIAHASARPHESLVHFPLCGGTPPELGWRSLELYADRVLPALAGDVGRA